MKAILHAAITWIHNTIVSVWNAVRGFFVSIWNSISSFFLGIWNGLRSIVGFATSWIRNTVSSVWSVVSGIFSSVWNGIKNTFSIIWDGLKSIVGDKIQWISDRIQSVTGFIARIWSDAWNGIKSTFQTIWDGIVDIFKKPINIILSAVRTFDHIVNNITDFVGMGKHLPEGGDVPTLARGGKLSGYGGGDRIPALLEAGEAVVPKHLVPEIEGWAAANRIPGFAAGGKVGAGIPETGGFSIPNPIDIIQKGVDIVKKVAAPVVGFVSDLPGVSNVMGALGAAKDWVVEGIKDAFRIGAAEALKGLLAPVRSAMELATKPFAKPGEMLRGVGNKVMDGIIEWVRGKEQAPPSSGGDMGSGTWSPGMAALVKQIVDKWHISAMTYAGHDPDAQHAADLALNQFGVIWDYNVNNPNNKYAVIARWIADNIVDKHRGQRFYVGTMASIHNAQRDAPGQWRPIASQQRGGALDSQTKGHHDHVHFSSPIDFGGTGAVGIGGGVADPARWARQGITPPTPGISGCTGRRRR